MHSMQSAILLY